MKRKCFLPRTKPLLCVDVAVWADSSSFMRVPVFGLQIPCSVKPISGTLWNDCPVMAASFGMYYNVIRRGYITWYNVRHIVACGFTMWTNITLRNKMALNKSIPSGSYRKYSFPFCWVCMGVVWGVSPSNKSTTFGPVESFSSASLPSSLPPHTPHRGGRGLVEGERRRRKRGEGRAWEGRRVERRGGDGVKTLIV